MPDAKAYSTADATALPGLVESDDLMTLLPAGTYNLTLDSTATATVPALTAGSIDQASPSIGDTLTVSGSNKPASGVAYQWQESADGATGWANISGATAETLDTSTGVTDDYYVRRGVEITGVQSMVYTSGVQVSAAASYTEQLVDNNGTGRFTMDTVASLTAPTVTPRAYLMFVSLSHASTVRKFLASWHDTFENVRIHTGTQVGVFVATETDIGVNGTHEDAALSGARHHMLIQAWSTEDTGTNTVTMNVEVYLAIGSGAWTQVISAQTTNGNSEIMDRFRDAAGKLLSRQDNSEVPDVNIARFALWCDTTFGPIVDLSVAANRDAFVSGGVTVDPATTQATYGTAASPVGTLHMLFDLYGDALNYNASPATHPGRLTLTPSGTFSNAV